jgi:(R,R)-butanediol dehydrogenase / meso-butanediol dehydrogenase / diacetyl reductase
MIEPTAVAVRAVRRSGLTLGGRAHVIGGGPVGCLVGLLATAAGATATMSEPSALRRKYATELGLTIVQNPDDLGYAAAGEAMVGRRSSGGTPTDPSLSGECQRGSVR